MKKSVLESQSCNATPSKIHDSMIATKYDEDRQVAQADTLSVDQVSVS